MMNCVLRAKTAAALSSLLMIVLIVSFLIGYQTQSANAQSTTTGLIVVPYFSPTSSQWNTIYQQASSHHGAIKYVIINPCSGPCSGTTALSTAWQNVISNLKSSDLGIITLGYIYHSSETISAIDYYLVNPLVKADGILFDGEGSTNNLASFSLFANYVHSLTLNGHTGVVYINPGCNCYSSSYLTSGAANVSNVYESNSARLSHISVPLGISADRLSAVVKLEKSCSNAMSDISTLSSHGIGNVYVTGISYSTLPSYFPNEVYYAATGVTNC